MYLVVPPRLEKQFLFLSPLVSALELPTVLSLLADLGITVLDLQKINYEKFLYESESIQQLNKNLALFKVRGTTFNI